MSENIEKKDTPQKYIEHDIEQINYEKTLERLNMANKNIRYLPITKGGKTTNYAEVKERIRAFRFVYPRGAILTKIISEDKTTHEVVVQATIMDENGAVLSTGYASENLGKSMVNKTSILENCVPLDTEILTRRGWKFYYQLKPTDEALSLNLETKKVEYTPIEAVNIYKGQMVVEIASSRFRAVCTHAHKWVVESARKNSAKGLKKVETDALNKGHTIITNYPQEVEGSDKGRRLGWLICDCEIDYTKNGLPSTAYINQSKPKNVAEIDRLFPDCTKTTPKMYGDSWMQNHEWIIPAERVREILGEFDILNYKDLPRVMASAPIEDVAGCLESMRRADGEARGFSSTYPELVEAVQIACARLGLSTTFITSRMCKKSTRPIYTIGIKTTFHTYVSELKIRELPPRAVWCPTTQNGTWFMRQGTFATLTSNCESGAVGRALGFAGFGIEGGVATAEEVKQATTWRESENSLYMCHRCGRPIRDTDLYTAERIARESLKAYGDTFCMPCLRELKNIKTGLEEAK